MKNIFWILGIQLCVFLAVPVMAQTPDSTTYRGRRVEINTQHRDSLGLDTLRRIDGASTDLIQLREGDRKGSLILEAGGFGLTLGQTPMQKLRNRRHYLSVLTDMEFGFTQLTGVDYSGYAPSEQGFLDQRLGSSFHFSFSIMQACFSLNRSRTLDVSIGFQYTIDNYRLMNNNITVGNEDGRIVPIALDTPAAKSKIVTSSLGIPIRLIYTPVRRLRFTAVAYSDFMLGADAIYKAPKVKAGLRGYNVYQFGVGATASYYGLGMYVRYGVTPLFKSSAGPKAHPLSFGVSYSLNL